MEELHKIFTGYLKEGEKIAWCGKPRQGVLIRDVDMIAIPMSLILLGFSLILNYAAFFYHAGFLFISLGILFGLLFIYAGILRFSMNARHRKNLFYCITTKRILVVRGRKKKLLTIPLKSIEELDVTVEKDKSGFITFGTVNPVWPWLLGGFYFTSQNIPGLELVPNVEGVYDILIEQLQSQVDIEVIARLRPGREDLN